MKASRWQHVPILNVFAIYKISLGQLAMKLGMHSSKQSIASIATVGNRLGQIIYTCRLLLESLIWQIQFLLTPFVFPYL